jgi:hypothetical protein
LNTVNCRVPLDEAAFAKVRDAFAEYFPKLRKRAAVGV